MKEFKIYLLETDPKYDKKIRWILVIYGVLLLSVGILLKYKYNIGEEYILIIGGTASLILALGYKKLVKRCHITLDDQGIKSTIFTKWMKLPLFEKTNIRWEEIKSIDIKPLKIDIYLNDGSQKQIELGDLMYKQHQMLKSKLQEYMYVKENKMAT